MKKLNWVLVVVVLSALVVMIIPGTAGAVADPGQAPVDLGSAGDFAILAKSGISTTGTTSIVGDIGISPAAATFITGFGLIMDASNQFSTSSLVTGRVYAADYAVPTPAKMTTAVSDMQTAYTNAAGRTLPTATELGAGNIGGMTLSPGLYKWSTGVIIPADVTLSGGPDDVWIFQIAQTLTVSNGVHVNLSGAQAANIFWQVAGQTTLGTTSVFNGNILDLTAIVLNNGATLNGRALAQTAVTLIANTIVKPTTSTASTPVTGITREVNGNILPGVSITLDGAGPVLSDQSGQYEIMATTTGNHTLVAHKDGFRDRTQTVNVAGLGQGYAVTCNFQGNQGLIPNAPNMGYALGCINHWLYPPNADTGLNMSTALAVINAWLHPIQ